MPRITPQEAGRLGGLKGGKSRSDKKLAACRRNGFQRFTPAEEPACHTLAKTAADNPENGRKPAAALLVVPRA